MYVKISNPLGCSSTTRKKAEGFVQRGMAEFLPNGELRFFEQNQRQRSTEVFYRTEQTGGEDERIVPRSQRKIWPVAPSLRTGPECPSTRLDAIAEVLDDGIQLVVHDPNLPMVEHPHAGYERVHK